LEPFHRTSIALHAANTALVIVLLYFLFGNLWLAAGVGLLFGLHPMTAEPVTWVSERKTLLGAFFSFLSLLCYLGYSRKKSLKLYAGCWAGYVLAVLAKPISVPLPALMLLMDYWPLGRLNKKAILEKIPLFIIGAVLAIIAYISQSRTAAVILPQEQSAGRIFFILCHNIVFYIHKILWPAGLSSHYGFPEPMGFSSPAILIGVIGTCVLIAVLAVTLWRTRAVAASWLFFFVAIFPTMGVIGFTVVIASDKYAYLPAFGFLMLVCFAAVRFCEGGKRKSRLAVTAAVILVLAFGEAVATRRYLVHWRDTVSLYEHMLKTSPDAAPLHSDIGVALQLQGRFDEAIAHFRRAVEIWPDYPETRNNLGIALQTRGEFAEAQEQFRYVLRQRPKHAQTYNNLGTTLQFQGDFEQAISYYLTAIELEGDFYDAYNNLGVALKTLGRFKEAEGYYRQALRINPSYAKAHNNLGVVLRHQGRFEEAIESYNRALQSDPRSAEAYYNLGNVYLSQNKPAEAIENFRRALELAPDNAQIRNKLNSVLESQQKQRPEPTP